MKFSCDRCHTRYSIPDERVKGKVLKIRCKTCGNVITVGGRKKRELKATDSSPAKRARAVRPKASAVGLPTSVDPALEHRSGRVAGRSGRVGAPEKVPASTARGRRGSSIARQAGPAGPEDFAEKTVVSDPNIDMDALRAELAAGPATVSDLSVPPRRTDAKAPPRELEEWYLADDHGEYGPMTFSELAARIRRREHGPDAQVWREGFADWMDLEAVPELRPHLKHVPPPRVRHHENWAEAEPEAAPVKLAAPPSELEAKPQPISAEESGPASAIPSQGRSIPSPQSQTVSPPRHKGGADAFFGKDGLQPASEESVSSTVPVVGPAEVAAAPNLMTADRPADRNRLFAVLFAIMGGVALLALSGLVLYLLIHDRGGTTSTKTTTVAQHKDQVPGPTAPRVSPKPRNQTTAQNGMTAPRQDDSTEELVMDPVELSLPPRSTRSTGPSRPRARSTSSERRGSNASRPGRLGSSFSTGSFGGFGPVGIRERRGTGPRVSSGKPRPIHATRKVTKPEVMAVIRRHVHRLKRCYERAVRLHPTELKRAKMKVTIRISASGRVARVGITPGRYRGLSLGDCIVSTIRTWKFPPSTSSYGTGFPLSFVGK